MLAWMVSAKSFGNLSEIFCLRFGLLDSALLPRLLRVGYIFAELRVLAPLGLMLGTVESGKVRNGHHSHVIKE